MFITAANDIFSLLDPPMWLITARHEERRGGLIATFVSQASIVPAAPRVVIGMAQQHYTWQLVEAAGMFVLHLLDEQNLDLIRRFGLQSGNDVDKFSGLEFNTTANGNPIMPSAPAWLECRVEEKMSTGDRTIYLAEVVAANKLRDAEPLRLKRMLQLAPPEMKAELKRQMERDQQIDEAAIARWRNAS